DVQPDQEEAEADGAAENERRDLVARRGGGEEPDPGHLGGEERGADVLREDDAGVGLGEDQDPERGRGRPRQGDQSEEEVADELAEHQVRLPDRLRGQPLVGAAAALLGEGAHRDGGDEHAEQPRQQREEAAQRRDVEREEGAERQEERERQERDDQNVGRRVVEVATELPARDRPRLLHASSSFATPASTSTASSAPSSPAGAAVSWRKTCSRLARSRYSSQRVHPRSPARRKIRGRRSSSPEEWIVTRTRPSTRSASWRTTSGSAASSSATPSPSAS